LMLISIVVVLFIAYWGLGLVLYFMQPALDDFVYLPYTAGEIDGGNLCHRLDDNRRGGADCNLSDIDSFGFSSFSSTTGNHIKIVACFRLMSKLKYS